MTVRTLGMSKPRAATSVHTEILIKLMRSNEFELTHNVRSSIFEIRKRFKSSSLRHRSVQFNNFQSKKAEQNMHTMGHFSRLI